MKRHQYSVPGLPSPLACDLVDETTLVLYEDMGDVRRASVRMAIGQLLGYQRFEEAVMKLSLLLPSRPARNLISLIHSVPASVVWKTKDGFSGADS